VTFTIDPSILVNYYNSKEGILTSSSSSSSASGATTSSSATKAAPTPPWSAKNASTQSATLANQVLAGQNIINPNAAQLDVPGETPAYQSLFSIYQGLNALNGLATDLLQATGAATASTGSNTPATSASASQITKALTTGLSQVSSYVNGLSLPSIRVTTGTVQSSASTTSGPTTASSNYTTGVIFDGGLNDPVPAFQGQVQFNINVTSYNGTQTTIPIDLSQLGSTARTVPNVVSYINSQLKAAGVITRFATSVQPGVAQTETVNGQKVTLPAGPDQWSFQIQGDSEESVSFSAPSTAAAVYVGQTSGDAAGYAAQTAAAASAQTLANETGTTAAAVDAATQVSAPIQQILKLQASDSTTATAPPAAVPLPGTANASSDQISANTLNSNISSIGATATGPDGSLYVLANVTGKVDGETPQSAQNIALQKYDSAGNLIYSTLLGSSGSVNGLSLAVSATGQVAVAGAVTGALTPTNPGNSGGAATSFVALYNAKGEQQWATTSTTPTNNQANAVAFAANGDVYVAGQNNTPSATVTSYGSPSGYLAGYSTTGAQLFNVATGTTNANGVAVDGSTVVVAGTQSGSGVVNSYTVPTSGAPTLTATRNLGALGSGSIAGVAINNGQVVVAGTTSNGALNAGAVTSGFSGTQDAFVAQLSENLAPSATDSVAYYGGTGATKATALTVSDGQVYIAGTSSGGLPGLTNTGKQEGFVANIDPTTGQVGWSQALAGQDGVDAPTTLAVASGGASVLDRLGLPTQTLQSSSSQLLTATTAVSAGDQFQIRTQAGVTAQTVTISATDTPQTLAAKIQQASGYQVNVSVSTTGGKQEVKITPEFPGETIELLPGASGKDALGPLGLAAGVIQTAPAIPTPPKVIPGVTTAPNSTTATSSKDTYGLNIDQDFNLTTTAGIQAAQKVIQLAMSTVQTAYTNLANGNSTGSTKPAVTGTVPAYLSSELANYQAGLSRLTGSSSSSSSSSSSNQTLGSALAGLLA